MLQDFVGIIFARIHTYKLTRIAVFLSYYFISTLNYNAVEIDENS